MQLTNAVIFFKTVNFRFKIDGSKENMKGIFFDQFLFRELMGLIPTPQPHFGQPGHANLPIGPSKAVRLSKNRKQPNTKVSLAITALVPGILPGTRYCCAMRLAAPFFILVLKTKKICNCPDPSALIIRHLYG